jgi:hypothetical protein
MVLIGQTPFRYIVTYSEEKHSKALDLNTNAERCENKPSGFKKG